MLIDTSKFGRKIKDGKNQKMVLDEKEVKFIEDNTFIRQKHSGKELFFLAGQYFEVKIEYVKLSEEDFNRRMWRDRISCLWKERSWKSP